jgi:hypothetical protein
MLRVVTLFDGYVFTMIDGWAHFGRELRRCFPFPFPFDPIEDGKWETAMLSG